MCCLTKLHAKIDSDDYLIITDYYLYLPPSSSSIVLNEGVGGGGSLFLNNYHQQARCENTFKFKKKKTDQNTTYLYDNKPLIGLILLTYSAILLCHQT